MLRGIIAVIFLTLAFLIPFYYYDLVKFSVLNLNAGWVFSTFYLRFLCIVFFVIALRLIFSYFKRTRHMKFIYVFLIGLLPGFGISFITPIYKGEYGDKSDNMQLQTVQVLKGYAEGKYDPGDKRHLVCFFSTDCGHCKNTSAKIGINQLAGMEIEVHAFFANPPADVEYFINHNNGQQFHSYVMSNSDLFLSISGFQLPSVFLIDRDGSTMSHWASDLNYNALDYIAEIAP